MAGHRQDLSTAWDEPVWPVPVSIGKLRLSITRNSRTGEHRYYVDDREIGVNEYLAITGRARREAEVRCRGTERSTEWT